MSTPKKRLGQHFLSDRRILGRIVAALDPQLDETVLEIGPGMGGLTAELASRTERLVAIEKDRDLIPRLRTRFPHITVIEADALKSDWHDLVGIDRPFSIVGNIPYNITSPLIDQALEPPRPRCIVFLVQKEVAERVTAGPGGSEYGALSVGVQSVARVERLFTVPAGAFTPKPKVDSAVLRLVPMAHPSVQDKEIEPFRRFVVGLFGFRRKQILRGLRELTGQPADTLVAALRQVEVEQSRRPQELSPAEFLSLFRVVV